MKTHNCLLKITNKSTFDMNFSSDWFDSGRVADGFDWPSVMRTGNFSQILCYERDWSLAGCSGFVKYRMGSTQKSPEITISFSNPVVGYSKLNVGNEGMRVWDEMTHHHNYRNFNVFLKISGKNLVFCCQCTGGTTNICTVEIEEADCD